MALREMIDSCGDESRNSNPILKVVDSFETDQSPFQDAYQANSSNPLVSSATHEYINPNTFAQQNDIFSISDEFSRFQEDKLAHDLHHHLGISSDPRLMRSQTDPMSDLPKIPYPIDLTMAKYFSDQYQPNLNQVEKRLDRFEDDYTEAMNRAQEEVFSKFDCIYQKTTIQSGLLSPSMNEDWIREFERSNGSKGSIVSKRSNIGFEKDNVETWINEFDQIQSQSDPFSNSNNAAHLKSIASQFAFIRDPKLQQSSFFKTMTSIGDGETIIKDNQLISSSPILTLDDMEKIESQFESQFESKLESKLESQLDSQINSQLSSHEFNEFIENLRPRSKEDINQWITEYQDDSQSNGSNQMTHSISFTDLLDPSQLSPYPFVTQNQLLTQSSLETNYWKQAQDAYQNGQISIAILSLEAAVQTDPTNFKAWHRLGLIQAENDQDSLASKALLHAVQLQPNHGDALLALSVSYTNDYHKHKALICLQQWLQGHEEYNHLSTQIPSLVHDFDLNHQLVTKAFLSAAQIHPNNPDPDIQVILGLLYNLTFQYNLAMDCFKTAAAKRPGDYAIWNKLGATQANAHQHYQALDSYQQSLKIHPNYPRVLCNVGVSLLALGDYGEAAKAFLRAIKINPAAEHRWDNLANLFTMMERPELTRKCINKDVEAFKDVFYF